MKQNKIIIFLISIFVVLSCFQQPILGGRLTLPDVFGGLLIGCAFLSGKNIKLNFFPSIWGIVVAYSIGIVFSISPMKSLFEVIILIFLMVISAIIYTYYCGEIGLKKLISYICITSWISGILGILSVFGNNSFFEERTAGEVSGSFRNAGQAGFFALEMITILFPLISSGYIKYLSKTRRTFIVSTFGFLLLFLLLTGKISAYIGFFFGIIFYVIVNKKFGNLLLVLVAIIALFFLYSNLEDISPEINKRVNNKIRTRITKNVENSDNLTDEDSFFATNYSAALKAFNDNPLTGSGIGAFSDSKYSHYEVHSTPIKLLGETGLLGTLGYLIFFISYFKYLWKVAKFKNNIYSQILYYTYPFMLGNAITWIYTYHLRKREFWILLTYTIIVGTMAKHIEYKKIQKQVTNTNDNN